MVTPLRRWPGASGNDTPMRRPFGQTVRIGVSGWRTLAAFAAILCLALSQAVAAGHARPPGGVSGEQGSGVCVARQRGDAAPPPPVVSLKVVFEPFTPPADTGPPYIARRQTADPPARAPPIR